MKVTGITIIRNAVTNDYPIVEAIRSILPLVDECIVAVGDSDDDTLGLIRSINSPKIRIEQTVWDMRIRKGGEILAVETNKVLDMVSADTDWVVYIQGDEVIHEKYHSLINKAMQHYLPKTKIEGLLFHYLHFYGTYDYVGDSRKWYKYETRIIRHHRGIRSYRDAQGFRKQQHQKIDVALIDAYVYHYGWVKNPKLMKQKQKNVVAFWNDNDEAVQHFQRTEDFFDYNDFDSIRRFEGTHPAVMKERIQFKNWELELDIRKKNMPMKYRLLYWIEKWTGKRLFTFTNHIIKKKFRG
jgi:glycosyltransferase involved in cell wall biosynthesis